MARTDVAFRVFPDGDVIALFPNEYWGGGSIASFQHVGQHGGASHDLIHELRPATRAEYRDLKRELEGAPYNYRLRLYKPDF